MNTPDYNWRDLQAAEYVVGTLTDDEQLEFEQQLQSDEELQELVLQWQIRLDPLNLTTQSVTPPSHVFNTIHAQLRDLPHRRNQPQGNVIDAAALWRRKAQLWRHTALASLAIAAAIIGLFLFNPAVLQKPTPIDTVVPVAILQNAERQTLWMVNYRSASNDSDTGELLISVVAQPQKEKHQSHQLWMVLPEGAGVQSVGMIPDEIGKSSSIKLPIPLSQAAELAVSIEDNGEVPGPEHGPVVARTFIIDANSGI